MSAADRMSRMAGAPVRPMPPMRATFANVNGDEYGAPFDGLPFEVVYRADHRTDGGFSVGEHGYRIRFADGSTTLAWPEEVEATPALDAAARARAA